MWIFMLFTAFAGPSPTPSLNLPESYRAMELTRRAMRRADWQDVRQQAARVLAFDDENDAEAALWMAVAHHRERRPADALRYYRAGLARQPDGPWVDHLSFGVAETLSELGNPKEAMRWLKRATRKRDLPLEDGQRVAIDEALFRLQRKGIAERPTRELMDLLDAMPPHVATVQQARARSFLVDQWLDLADGLEVLDPVVVERRTTLMLGARLQVDATAELGEHRLVLEQIDRLALAYERLGDDVLAEQTRPTTDVRNVWKKASELWEVAQRHAARIDHEGELARFQGRYNAMGEKLSALEHSEDGLGRPMATQRD